MTNEYLKLEVGTVLKDVYNDSIDYYLVGPYFVYCNDYDWPYIRPYKFVRGHNTCIASAEEKEQFIKDLKDNHLIINEKGELVHEEHSTISVNITFKTDLTPDKVLDILKKMTSEFDTIGTVKSIELNND